MMYDFVRQYTPGERAAYYEALGWGDTVDELERFRRSYAEAKRAFEAQERSYSHWGIHG